MQITDFYANREIFITGATGFLGKALIEKVLRDIPTIKVLYILIRGKKSFTAEQRLEQLKTDKVFNRIHQECPQVLKKLYAIQGDCQELGLGIKPNDLELLKNVSIIFHMAANVKFDDPLKSSILLNTRGTYEVVKIAEKLKNLIVFMHCSTGYCNPFNEVIEEKVYKMPVDWRKTIKIAETCDDYTINSLCCKYTGFYPNSYTFTKNLSEQIIQEYSAKLPMVIFRPTVVLSSYKEPVPGWIDNMNGGLPAIIGAGVGVLPIMYSKGNITLDCIPIDMVTNLTIIAAYKRGIQFFRKTILPNGLDVINCASNNIFKVDMATASKLYINSIKRNPMENCIWSYDTFFMTTCYYNFLFQLLMANIPLALIIDSLLFMLGRKAIIMKITRRIIYTIRAVCFFSLREYKLKNDNMFDLLNWIPENEGNKFKTIVNEEVDVIEYFDNVVAGVKYNLFNQSAQANESTRKRYKILSYVNQMLKFLLFSLVVISLWSIISKI